MLLVFICACIQEMLFPYFKLIPSLNKTVPISWTVVSHYGFFEIKKGATYGEVRTYFHDMFDQFFLKL